MTARAKKLGTINRQYDYVGSFCGVQEYVLKKNGLRVLYQYDGTAPVVGVMVTYLVGSRHEPEGSTGATHILEHLMFKGSKQFPPKNGVSVLDVISKKGALVNASTWLDRTNYYEVLPEEHFEFAVQLEADRMRNALLTEHGLRNELPAVISEYMMHVENDPFGLLEERMWATAFITHPYHHPTIGWRQDIEHASLKTLREFYDTYYHPDNAVVTVVGSVGEEKALRAIATYFGNYPRSQQRPLSHTQEPEQEGKRFVEVVRAGTKQIVALGFKAPEALHKDTPALLMLSAVLGEGQASRMYRALVEKRHASKAWSSYMPFQDPSLLMLYALPTETMTHEKIETLLWRVCEDVVQKGVTQEELERVRAQVLTEIAFARDGHYALLATLNEAIATGDWHFFFNLPKAFERVTCEDVQRVAEEYLSRMRVTVGYYRADTKSYES